MNEFINKLIERLEDTRWTTIFDTSCIFENDKLDKCIEIVNQLAEEYKHCALCYLQSPCEYQNENAILPNELLENGWIPCREMLPEEGKMVLTCAKDGWISVNANVPYNSSKNDFECGYYVAWMPLPPAYQPKGE